MSSLSRCLCKQHTTKKQIWPGPATRAILFGVKHPAARQRGRHRAVVLSALGQVSPARSRAQVYAALPAFAADAGGLVLVRGLPARRPLCQPSSLVAETLGAATPGSIIEPSGSSTLVEPPGTAGFCDALAQRSGHLTSALRALCLSLKRVATANPKGTVQNLCVCSDSCGRLRKFSGYGRRGAKTTAGDRNHRHSCRQVRAWEPIRESTQRTWR